MDEAGASRGGPRARARLASRIALVLAAPLLWAGCSVEKHYALLNFFFDGVPNPNLLPILAASGDPASIRLSKTYTAHQPFLDQQCSACHTGRFDMRGVADGVCFTCHQGVQEEHAFMHGPVVVGVCMWCHVAHESAYPALLKHEARTVCVQCHEPALLPADQVPEHADESISCLVCHVGHGSDGRFLLRRDWSASRGATRGGAGERGTSKPGG